MYSTDAADWAIDICIIFIFFILYIYIYIYIYIIIIIIIIACYSLFCLFCLYFCIMSRVFANGLGDLASIPGRVIPDTFKMVLDNSLLNTQQYKVRIEAKVEQSRVKNSAHP